MATSANITEHTDTAQTIEEFNDIQIRKFAAPIAYLVILMILGIPGNLSILLIYRTKKRKSVYRTIIWNLALTDFSFCVIGIPFNIGEIIRYYTFTDLWSCKIFAGIIIFLILYSSHLLVLLSFHRFRQVCMSFKKQITPKNITYWIIGAFFISAFFNIPQLILQTVDEVQLEANITGHVCAVAYKVSTFSDIYNGFLVFLFIFYATVLFVFYLLIGRKMFLQRKIKSDSAMSSDEVSNKITKIAITVSVVFVISYLPIYILKLAANVIDQEALNDIEFGATKIFERSYAINHVINPFIYAFYDNRFRRQVKMLFISPKNQPSEETSDYRTTSFDKTMKTDISKGKVEKTSSINTNLSCI